tara:strand:+ start:465 stop:785 length:321 start_codon:yes stop_codon:yes gene_type:complete
MQENFKTLDKTLQFKIDIFELLINYEIQDIEFFKCLVRLIKKDYKSLPKSPSTNRDNSFIDLLTKLLKLNKTEAQKEIKLFENIYKHKDLSKSDIINYNNWLNDKF